MAVTSGDFTGEEESMAAYRRDHRTGKCNDAELATVADDILAGPKARNGLNVYSRKLFARDGENI